MKKTSITLLLTLGSFRLAAQCPMGDVTFSTQAQIDNFPTNYPGCKHFTQNVTIGGAYCTLL